MVTYNDQLELFKLISKNLSKDVTCYAFGGNAMMFYGYKDETRDIDLLFEKEGDRKAFIKALIVLGYEKISPAGILMPKKLKDKHAPLMYKRGDDRFDLFVEQVFRAKLSPKMREDLYAVHEFRTKKNLVVKVLRKEYIVFMKATTERSKDFEDVFTLLQKDKHFDWDYLVKEAIWQHKHNDAWALIDLEKMMKDMKKEVFIPEKYFKVLYKAQAKK